MDNKEKKITLSEEIQLEMLKFFMKTSIPRIKKEKSEKEKAVQTNNLMTIKEYDDPFTGSK